MAEPISTGAMAIYAALTAATVATGIHQQNKMEKKSENLRDAQAAAANEKASRERRQRVQQMLVQQGAMENAAAVSGTAGTSAAIGGMGQAGMNAAVDIGTINSNLAFGNEIARRQRDFAMSQQPSNFQQILGAGQQIAGNWMMNASSGPQSPSTPKNQPTPSPAQGVPA